MLGKLHPHGDGAVHDALVHPAQPFAVREPLARYLCLASGTAVVHVQAFCVLPLHCVRHIRFPCASLCCRCLCPASGTAVDHGGASGALPASCRDACLRVMCGVRPKQSVHVLHLLLRV